MTTVAGIQSKLCATLDQLNKEFGLLFDAWRDGDPTLDYYKIYRVQDRVRTLRADIMNVTKKERAESVETLSEDTINDYHENL